MTDSNLVLVVPKVVENINNHLEQLLGVLKHHPIVIARKCSVPSLLKGKNKASGMNRRIPFPFKFRKEFATGDDGDEWFHGVKMIGYSNGEMWCHVELIAYKNEGYNRFAPEMYDIKLCYEETEKEFHSKKKPRIMFQEILVLKTHLLKKTKCTEVKMSVLLKTDIMRLVLVLESVSKLSIRQLLMHPKKSKLNLALLRVCLQDVVLLRCLYQT